LLGGAQFQPQSNVRIVLLVRNLITKIFALFVYLALILQQARNQSVIVVPVASFMEVMQAQLVKIVLQEARP
jgi:hypothetical protein